MDEYGILLKWRLEHEYYPDGICRGVDLYPDAATQTLFLRQKLLFKRLAVNEWAVCGKKNTAWREDDRIVLEKKVQDPELFYVTVEQEEDWEISPQACEPGEEIRIHYRVKCLFWEYLLIAREEEEARPLEIREVRDRLKFKAPEKITFEGREAWKVVSEEPVELRENYDFRLQLIRKEAFGERVIYRQLPFPQPGRFRSGEENGIRQLVYY